MVLMRNRHFGLSNIYPQTLVIKPFTLPSTFSVNCKSHFNSRILHDHLPLITPILPGRCASHWPRRFATIYVFNQITRNINKNEVSIVQDPSCDQLESRLSCHLYCLPSNYVSQLLWVLFFSILPPYRLVGKLGMAPNRPLPRYDSLFIKMVAVFLTRAYRVSH